MRSRARGFTLVELLVVIAIIGILVGLLLPAVQAAREAARRMSCGNNVKQLSLALQNYHVDHNTFPSDTIWMNESLRKTTTKVAGNQRNYTWITLILPKIEQGPLYDQIDFRLPIWGQLVQNKPSMPEIRSQRVATLECPSDAPYPDTDFTHGFSWTSYAAAEGWDNWARRGDFHLNGVFPFDGTMAIRDIRDGTSNTLAIGEVGTRSVNNCKGITGWAANRNAGTGCIRATATGGVFRVALVGTTVRPNVAQDTRKRHGGFNLLHPDGTPITSWWNGGEWDRPYAYSPRYRNASGINSVHWLGPSSTHPGGAMFGRADGSVAFVAETVEVGNWNSNGRFGNVWASMHSVAGRVDAAPVVWD